MSLLDHFTALSDKAQIALIIALITLLGLIFSAIISAFVAWMTASRSQYLSAVTAEHSRRINDLRENIASLSGILRTLSFQVETGQLDEDKKKATIAEITKLISLINLQLDPHGLIEREVDSILEQIPGLAERNDDARLRDVDKLLIAHCRWLLKAEWEKVKFETHPRRWQGIETGWYLWRYRCFRRHKGRIPHGDAAEDSAGLAVLRQRPKRVG